MMKTMPPKPEREAKIYPKLSWYEIIKTIERECGSVWLTEKHNPLQKHHVIFLPEATMELKCMVTYGRRSPMNRLEQKIVGFGHFFHDEDEGINIVVSHVIQIPTMNRSRVSASNLGPHGEMNAGLHFLEYYREEFRKYEKEFNCDAHGKPVDPFLEKYGPSEYVMEAHTHPDLGAFISHTDHKSGSARAAACPVCIFVCDPIRMEMIGRIGKDFAEAEVMMYERSMTQPAICDAPTVWQCPPIEGGKPEQPVCQESTVDDILRMAHSFLRRNGYCGNIKSRTCLHGRVKLQIQLILPRKRKGGSHAKRT